MYCSSLIFIVSCLVYAYYSYCQIKKGTKSWEWHLSQWLSVLGFVGAGVVFGRGINAMDWHKFGEVIGLAVLGIPAYVFFLHYLLRKK